MDLVNFFKLNLVKNNISHARINKMSFRREKNILAFYLIFFLRRYSVHLVIFNP